MPRNVHYGDGTPIPNEVVDYISDLYEELCVEFPWDAGDLIVLDKPAGLVVHPAPGNPDGTLVNALLAHCGPGFQGIGAERRPGIVHRLDKDTSGVMVVAKTQLANHKHYFASDYYARQNYLKHYSPKMRRLIQQQRAA